MKLIYATVVLACICVSCTAMPVVPAKVNANPVIVDIIYARDTMAVQDLMISCIARDPDDDPLTYKWAAEGGQFSGSGSDVIYISPDTMGDYNLEVTVSDDKGGSDNRTFSMRVLTNADGTTTPFITLSLSASSKEPAKVTRTVKVGTKTRIACSPDSTLGPDLHYAWSSGGGILKGDQLESGSCSTAFFIAPPNVGHYFVTVTATHKNGNEARGLVDFDVFCCPRY